MTLYAVVFGTWDDHNLSSVHLSRTRAIRKAQSLFTRYKAMEMPVVPLTQGDIPPASTRLVRFQERDPSPPAIWYAEGRIDNLVPGYATVIPVSVQL